MRVSASTILSITRTDWPAALSCVRDFPLFARRSRGTPPVAPSRVQTRRGGPAHPVTANEGRHLARRDGERHAEQHLAEAVAGLDVRHLEQRAISHDAAPAHRDRLAAPRRWP